MPRSYERMAGGGRCARHRRDRAPQLVPGSGAEDDDEQVAQAGLDQDGAARELSQDELDALAGLHPTRSGALVVGDAALGPDGSGRPLPASVAGVPPRFTGDASRGRR